MTERDEATDLRTALTRGQWQRLTEPLVLALALSDPAWWSEGASRCLDEIAYSLGLTPPRHLRMLAPSTMAKDLRFLRATVRALGRPLCREMLVALDVIERGP